MKQIFLLFSALILSLSACTDDSAMRYQESRTGVFSQVYNGDQIPSQTFTIQSDQDTILQCENGTKIHLYANSFTVSGGGNIDQVQIEVKEAFKPIDFVMGNLTTTSEGFNLASGGMVFVNATSEGKQLRIAGDSEIGVIVPTTRVDTNMFIFEGLRDSFGIEWREPDLALNRELQEIEMSYVVVVWSHWEDENVELGDDLKEWLLADRRKVGDKTIHEGVDITVEQISFDEEVLTEGDYGLFISDAIRNKGENGYAQDYNTSYIFSLRNLGWSNIDRYYDDDEADVVAMNVQVDNFADFGYVYTTLILPDHNMYLPGYQREDNTYGFSSNDLEMTLLPIGAPGILMATAYKDSKPYFSLQKVTIRDEMDIALALEETTGEGLRAMLEENI